MALRSAALQKEYDSVLPAILEIGCPLCLTPPLHTFRFWKIIDAKYPYDLVATKHHVVLPIRHTVEAELTDEEEREFRELKDRAFDADYEYVIDPIGRRPSVPNHFHQHLIVTKPEPFV